MSQRSIIRLSAIIHEDNSPSPARRFDAVVIIHRPPANPPWSLRLYTGLAALTSIQGHGSKQLHGLVVTEDRLGILLVHGNAYEGPRSNRYAYQAPLANVRNARYRKHLRKWYAGARRQIEQLIPGLTTLVEDQTGWLQNGEDWSNHSTAAWELEGVETGGELHER